MFPVSEVQQGLELLLQPEPLLWLAIGLILGFIAGALPAFDSANAAALLLSFSIVLRTETALIMMAAVYVGAQVAGAVPAVLLNVPGTAGAAATALDGYPMAQQGKGGLAIGVARAASTVGGIIGGFAVLMAMPPMSRLALNFGSPEMFVVAVFGLTIIGSVTGKSLARGLLSGFMGLLIASMAASPATGQARLSFGFLELYEDVPFVPVVIGVFGMAQMLVFAAEREAALVQGATAPQDAEADSVAGRLALLGRYGRRTMRRIRYDLVEGFEGAKITVRSPGNTIRSSIIGTLVGVVPGMGTSIGNFISYAEARRVSKDPQSFGKGNPQGVIASEATDNAVAAGSLVPTLALGIPGSATAAIMLAALYLHGVQPGPRVMQQNSAEAYAVVISVIIASALILPIGIVLAAPMIRVVQVPKYYLIPLVMVIAMVGALALRGSLFDVGLMMLFGAIGFVMRQADVPVVPMVLGLILGPIAESNLVRALALGRGDLSILWASTTSKVLIALTIIVVAYTAFQEVRSRQRMKQL
jgi:putative tricarboxylic transport membrane protein